jgi:DNA-directed RNA polymerase subunit M/transcription elongation factor TFIIS
MTRQTCIDKFNSLLDNTELSKKIEESIYNYSVSQSELKCIDPNIENNSFKRIYVNKIMSIFNNLDTKSYINNNNFLERLKNEEFNVENIAFLSPQEINKEHWKKYLDRQNANDEFLYSRTMGIRTNEYKCRRCKENICTYYQLQVRCSDEPMTTFVNCLNCGKRWSIN